MQSTSLSIPPANENVRVVHLALRVTDPEVVDEAIERVVTAVDSIAHDAQIIVKRGTKIGKAAKALRDQLADEVERLADVVQRMRGPVTEEGAA
jgi:hypothetical protein